MWTPWRNKTGLAKAAVILTTILSIATISCGVNLALAFNTSSQAALNVFMVAGWIELGTIMGSLLGLVVVLVMWLVTQGRKGDKNGGTSSE